MARGKGRPLRQDDLDRAIRSVAEAFGTDTVYVVGSQALLVGQSDIARELCYSHEFDMYPGGAAGKAPDDQVEASEIINAHFGEGSQFHQTHGFFIDGVDESTARLPPDWKERAVYRRISDHSGKEITAIAPAPAEIVAAKLVRGDQKDVEFAARCLRLRVVTKSKVRDALAKTVAGEELADCLRRVERASRVSRATSS